jgi:hypothetical protein
VAATPVATTAACASLALIVSVRHLFGRHALVIDDALLIVQEKLILDLEQLTELGGLEVWKLHRHGRVLDVAGRSGPGGGAGEIVGDVHQSLFHQVLFNPFFFLLDKRKVFVFTEIIWHLGILVAKD